MVVTAQILNQHTTRPILPPLQIAACIPILLNGKEGLYGWIPVTVDGKTYIVLSVTICDSMIRHITNMVGGDIKNFLEVNLKRDNAFVNSGSSKQVKQLFKKIMLKVPYSVLQMKTPAQVKINLSRYIIMDKKYFKGLVAETKLRCVDRPTKLPEGMAKEMKIAANQKASYMSVLSGSNRDDVVYPEMDKMVVTYEDRSRMPAWKVAMWKEAYASGCADYFGMEEVDGKIGHVIDGEYVAATDDMYARSYDEVMALYDQQMEDDLAAVVAKNVKAKRAPKSRKKRRVTVAEVAAAEV